MALWGDYHTHTVFSHGKGSIEDNVLRAVRKGLFEIAVTDHGFNHIAFGVRRREISRMRSQIERLKIKYPQIKVYLGVEANIVNTHGCIDVRASDKPHLDIIVCGYHKFAATSSFAALWNYFLPNNLGLSGAKTVARNTEAYVKALEKNEIDILSHPGNFCKCDVREVARACKYFGTYFEINGKRLLLADEELAAAAQEGCEFILDSDAHRPRNVGDVSQAMQAAERVGIPLTMIANYDRLPSFRSHKRTEKGGAP